MLWPKHLITKLKKIKESFCDRAGLSTVNGACFTNGFIPKCSFIIYPRAESGCWYSGERCTVQMPGCALNSAGCCFFFLLFAAFHTKSIFLSWKRKETKTTSWIILICKIYCALLFYMRRLARVGKWWCSAPKSSAGKASSLPTLRASLFRLLPIVTSSFSINTNSASRIIIHNLFFLLLHMSNGDFYFSPQLGLADIASGASFLSIRLHNISYQGYPFLRNTTDEAYRPTWKQKYTQRQCPRTITAHK